MSAPVAAAPGPRVIRPQAGPQEAFLLSPADIVIYGGEAGGGKTYGLLLEPVRHCQVPGYGAVIFRRNATQVRNEGGLWDTSMEIYPLLGATPRESVLEWEFPRAPGADKSAGVKFTHLEYESTVLSHQGAQIPFVGFDELTHFTARQFWYMLSRNRSTCGVRPYVRATTNPVPPDDPVGGWVAQLIAWWIDEEGYPIPERSGVVRWFVRIRDELIWADTAAELEAKYPGTPPKSLTFIHARLEDNPILMEKDPGYLANLEALPYVERMRLRGGNWKVKPEAGAVFNRATIEVVDALPAGMTRFARGWDKAGTVGSGADYTAGVLIGHHDGTFYVIDVVRGQWAAAEREKLMKQTAQLDTVRCAIEIEQEPGSGGKESAEASIKNLAGFNVHASPSTANKVEQAQPFAVQCGAGNVKVLRAPWTEAYLTELHAFPTKGVHDDQVDASARAFKRLTHGIPLGFKPIGGKTTSTWRNAGMGSR